MAEAIVLALAQICAFEAGLSTITNDCPAIAQVLRARRLDTPKRMFRYSKVRGWPRGLTLDLAQPQGWPRRLAWARHAPRWASRVREARRILRTKPRPCPRGTRHWGAPGFRAASMRQRGFVESRCGRTHNQFWRIDR